MRIQVAGPAAAGFVALAWALWYFGQEPQFRRDPVMETLGLVRIAATYEARYEQCDNTRYERNAGLRGLALGLIGQSVHRFPALSDAAAVRFARAALPACTLTSLMRKRRFTLRRSYRIERIPVDVTVY